MPAVRSGISAQYRLIGGVQHRFGERKQSLAHGREHQRHTTATHEQVAGIKIFKFCNGLTDRGLAYADKLLYTDAAASFDDLQKYLHLRQPRAQTGKEAG